MIPVIIVDDEILVRVGFKSIINWEEYGYTVVCEAEDGEEALEKIREYGPKIMFTDLKMERMDGFELIRRCRNQYPDLQIVVLSSFNDVDNVKEAMKLGAKDYIFKLTVKKDELLKVLKDLEVNINELHPNTIVRKNLAVIKTSLITDGIEKNYSSPEMFLEDFFMYNFRIDLTKPYYLLYISIDNYLYRKNKGEFSEVQLLKFSMENIIQEVLSKTCTAEVFNYIEGDIIALVQDVDKMGDIGQIMMEISEYLKRYLNISVTATFSKSGQGVAVLHDMMEQTKFALKCRFFQKSRLLCTYEDAPKDAKPLVLPKLQELSEALTLCEYSRFEEIVEYYFEVLQTWENKDVEQVRKKLLALFNFIKQFAFEYRDGEYAEGIEESTLYNLCLYGDYLLEIKEAFRRYIKLFIIPQDVGKEKRRPEIRKIEYYLKEHLDEEITVNAAAEIVHMSKSYFSYLFKNETGKSFIDYVNHLRVEKARHLLVNTDLRISEIAEKCGYQNANYFGIIFKKITGRSPGEFRAAVYNGEKYNSDKTVQ